ncbi:hypothetical protein FACS1894189_0800 [Planctomycetales bacterium]|nr:hypothetical protein FACS1894189_0800 [Planctomycetales bacterium]
MKNIFGDGLQWLSNQQREFVSSPVVYCRDEKEYPVSAVLGRTRYEIVDDNGFTVSSHTTDFLIEATALPFDPQTGDRIIAQKSIYEVIDLGTGCWTWCEPHQIRRRIHSQLFTKQ